MAAVNDCFTIGSTVLCTTCFNQEVEGEVMAFDHNTKMLILKRLSKTSDHDDVFVLNLSLCSNVQVIKENNGNFVDDPPKLNVEQLQMRLRKTRQHRQTYFNSINAAASPEGQELYRAIAKQFKYNEVCWQGSNIQIFKEVVITPPYKVDNVSSTSNRKLCEYIKKMVEQFYNTRSAAQKNLLLLSTTATANQSSSLAHSTSSSSSSSSVSLPSSAVGQSSAQSLASIVGGSTAPGTSNTASSVSPVAN